MAKANSTLSMVNEKMPVIQPMRAPLRMLSIWPVRRLCRERRRRIRRRQTRRAGAGKETARHQKHEHRCQRGDEPDAHRQPVVKTDLGGQWRKRHGRKSRRFDRRRRRLRLFQARDSRIVACRTCGKSERPAAIARHRCRIRARFQFDTGVRSVGTAAPATGIRGGRPGWPAPARRAAPRC